MKQGFSITLKDIYLGKVDGLMEAESDDKDFVDLFYTGNNKYNELNDSNTKFIISGRKGTGKTILAKYYQKMFCDTHLCSDAYIKFNHFETLKLIEDSKDNMVFYQFYIYKTIAETLLNKKFSLFDFIKYYYKVDSFKISEFFKYQKALKKLAKIYNSRYMYEDTSIFQKKEISEVYGDAKNSFKKNRFSFDSSIGQNVKIEKNFDKTPYFKFLENFQNRIKEVIKYVDVLIIIDDFDELEVSYDELLSTIRNFIEICKDINTNFFSRKSSKCLLLIRDDILLNVNTISSNMQKTISDCAVRLNWIDNNHADLMNMLCNKIKNSNSNLKNEKLDKINEMFIKDKYVVDRLLDYSFGRPRDIIQYLNIAKRNNPDKTTFNLAMLNDCELEYSKAFLGELQNELQLNNDSKMLNDMFVLIQDVSKTKFKFDIINEIYTSNPAKYPNIYSLEESINILYEAGAIGNQDEKTEFYSWIYRANGAKKVDFNKLLVIHNGLKKSLNLKQRNKSGRNHNKINQKLRSGKNKKHSS